MASKLVKSWQVGIIIKYTIRVLPSFQLIVEDTLAPPEDKEVVLLVAPAGLVLNIPVVLFGQFVLIPEI